MVGKLALSEYEGVGSIYAGLILAGMILLFAAVFYFSYRKGVWERFFDEFRSTIDEAHIVKSDLDNMLEKSISISRTMVDDIDYKMAELNQLQNEAMHTQILIQQIAERRMAVAELSGSVAEVDGLAEESNALSGEMPAKTNKIRVYELARELNMNSKELVVMLQELGFPVNSQLNTLDYELSLPIRQKIMVNLTGANLGMDSSADNDRVILLDSFKPIDDVSIIDIDALREAHPYLAVRTLQEKGYSICEMAQLLNRGQGEISLIINLINKKRVCV